MYNNLKGKKIVFFGDSITDTCKSFNKEYPYGSGYVSIIRGDLHSENKFSDIEIFNEGISGNKTEDLLARIDSVISINPDIVFLLIGVNDIWHPFEEGLKLNYNSIIDRISTIIEILSKNSKVVVLTPFLFPTDEFFLSLKPHFDNFMKIYLSYLNSHSIEYIDTNSILNNLVKTVGALGVVKDSVHPTMLGHGAIAQAILDYLKDK